MIATLQRLLPPHDPNDGGPEDPSLFGSFLVEQEDLAYKVELWNDAKTAVEQVLAVTVSASLGYAAYYAATKEYAERYLTLRHKNRILSWWNGPSQ